MPMKAVVLDECLNLLLEGKAQWPLEPCWDPAQLGPVTT